jgi:integrase
MVASSLALARSTSASFTLGSATGKSSPAPNSLDAAWAKCLVEAQIDKRFTIHGLRYTFSDLVRLANVDAVVRRALTGHVTEEIG